MEQLFNYRHRAHAANLSDVLKHLCLSSLRHLPGLETVWDAFAAEAYTPRASLQDREPLLQACLALRGPASVQEFQQQLRELHDLAGEPVYPGSASILAGLDAVQQLLLSDHDPECTAHLSRAFSRGQGPRVQVLCMDSVRDAGIALAHGPDMVFIDPPFLAEEEWDGIVALLDQVWQTRADGRVVLWYPRRDGFQPPAALRRLPGWRMRFHFDETQGLQGCIVLMLNFGAELAGLLGPLAACLDGRTLPGLRAAQCEYRP